eukprot:1143302-Pelagomonas_calceolata.AAC.3
MSEARVQSNRRDKAQVVPTLYVANLHELCVGKQPALYRVHFYLIRDVQGLVGYQGSTATGVKGKDGILCFIHNKPCKLYTAF